MEQPLSVFCMHAVIVNLKQHMPCRAFSTIECRLDSLHLLPFRELQAMLGATPMRHLCMTDHDGTCHSVTSQSACKRRTVTVLLIIVQSLTHKPSRPATLTSCSMTAYHRQGLIFFGNQRCQTNCMPHSATMLAMPHAAGLGRVHESTRFAIQWSTVSGSIQANPGCQLAPHSNTTSKHMLSSLSEAMHRRSHLKHTQMSDCS